MVDYELSPFWKPYSAIMTGEGRVWPQNMVKVLRTGANAVEEPKVPEEPSFGKRQRWIFY